MVEPRKDPVPAKIERVLVNQQEAVVLIAPENGEFPGKVLPVFVDLGQAMNIQVGLDGRMMGRPLTHDLFTRVLNEMGGIVDHIIIEDIAQNTFFATLHLEMDKNGKREKVSFDARPSDCLALAVRSGAHIQVRRKVFEAAAVEREKIMTRDVGSAPDLEETEEEEEDEEPSEPSGKEGGEGPKPKRGTRLDPGEAERP